MSELTTTENGVAKKEESLMARLIKFNTYLDKAPNPNHIKRNNGVKYLPIRIVENYLRSVFGVFQVEMIGRPQVIGNSVEVSVHLKVYHPVLKEWLIYAGTGAVPIQLRAHKKDRNGQIIEAGAQHPLDFEKIISTALHKNVPSALSFAVNNAAKKIGRIFGSDLNSDEITETYKVYGGL